MARETHGTREHEDQTKQLAQQNGFVHLRQFVVLAEAHPYHLAAEIHETKRLLLYLHQLLMICSPDVRFPIYRLSCDHQFRAQQW